MNVSTVVSRMINSIRSSKGFDQVLKKVNITSLQDGKLIANLKVEEEHLNCMGGIHGGFSATLVDSLSSFALMSHKNGAVPSVSVDLNLTYLKGAKLGDEIEINADTLRAGKTLAFLDITIKNKSTGDLMIRGRHTKFLLRKE